MHFIYVVFIAFSLHTAAERYIMHLGNAVIFAESLMFAGWTDLAVNAALQFVMSAL